MVFITTNTFSITENEIEDMVRQVKSGDSAYLVLRIWGMKLNSKDHARFRLVEDAIKAEIKRRAEER